MKELLERLVEVGVEFGIMGKVKSGVRDWSEMVGVGLDNVEEFVKRVIYGCSLNFNYVEEGVEGLKSEVLWKWVRDGYEMEGLKKFNLVEVRLKKFELCEWWIRGVMGLYKLEEVIKWEWFWNDLWCVYGMDKVSKRINLCRMMLKDMGLKIWDMNKEEIVVDYNLLCVFKYMGVIDYKGDFKDEKEEVDKLRVEVYRVMEGLLEEVKKEGKDGSWLDGLLFMLGRELRKRDLVNVCLYYGCVDY